MKAKEKFQVVFPEWYDERGEWEAKEKGWLQGVEVRFSNGEVHPVFFYDPVRLAQDLEYDLVRDLRKLCQKAKKEKKCVFLLDNCMY